MCHTQELCHLPGTESSAVGPHRWRHTARFQMAPQIEQSRLEITGRDLVWQLHMPAVLLSGHWLITSLHLRHCLQDLPICIWIESSRPKQLQCFWRWWVHTSESCPEFWLCFLRAKLNLLLHSQPCPHPETTDTCLVSQRHLVLG